MPKIIDDEDELKALTQQASGAAWLALDSEGDGFHRYRSRLCVLQLAVGEVEAIVDPLALARLEAIAPLGGHYLANEDVEPAAIWAAGGVSNEEGKLHLTAGLYRTADPLQDLDAEIDFKGLQRGWTSPEAEIHLVVRSHGQAITEDDGYLEQISNFNDDFGGCCENQQAAPYAPNEGGQKTLYMMSDRAEIGGTKAILLRRGDLLQAVIETIDPALVSMEDTPSLPVSPKAAADAADSMPATGECLVYDFVSMIERIRTPSGNS